MARRLTTEEFKEKARDVHGDRYDYSKVEYVNAVTKVCIVCPVHGEFWQIPASHLKGIGCKKCGIEHRSDARRLSKEEFISKAKETHGDRYDYSQAEYVNSKTDVCIVCQEHGEFWQTPANHLSGNGCPKCSGTEKLTAEEFIERSRDVPTVQTGLLHDPRGCWDGVETRHWPLAWVLGEAQQRPCHTQHRQGLESRTGWRLQSQG